MLLGMEMVWLEAECSRYEFFADVVAQTNPDIGLVAIDKDPAKALELVSKLGAILARLLDPGGELGQRRQLDPAGARAGAKEFLTQPVRIEDLLAALGRISQRRFGQRRQRPRQPGDRGGRRRSAEWARPAWP